MTILVVLCHPDPKSFNAAITRTAVSALEAEGREVVFHDLYAEGFDPVLGAEEIPTDGTVPDLIRAHCAELAGADGIVIVHPNWWGQPPALLKGWVDRVFRPEVAYRFLEGDGGEGVPVGLLKARAAVVFNTSNTPEARERDVFGDPLEMLWKKCLFDLCGVKDVRRRTFCVMVTSSPEQRRAWLEEVESTVSGAFRGFSGSDGA